VGTRSLVEVKAALSLLAAKIQRWKNSDNRYVDLFTLAECRRELGTISDELRDLGHLTDALKALELEHPLEEAARVELTLFLYETGIQIDTIAASSFFLVLWSIDMKMVPDHRLPYSLQMLDHFIISLVVMDLESKESLTLLLKKCLELLAMMLELKVPEAAPLYRHAEMAYKAVKSRGRMKYGIDFGTDQLL
jgi:hypothetical protein